jgi:hypothetical protein
MCGASAHENKGGSGHSNQEKLSQCSCERCNEKGSLSSPKIRILRGPVLGEHESSLRHTPPCALRGRFMMSRTLRCLPGTLPQVAKTFGHVWREQDFVSDLGLEPSVGPVSRCKITTGNVRTRTGIFCCTSTHEKKSVVSGARAHVDLMSFLKNLVWSKTYLSKSST